METAVLHSSSFAGPSASTHSAADGLVVLSVSAGGEMFAIDVRSVREIHAWTPPTSLPGAPAYVQGMLNIEGEVVPLVVLARRLGLADTRPTAPVTVMIERDEDIIGLVVDGVCDLHSISADQICETPAGGGEESAKLLRGVITLDNALMCLIDVESILPATAAVPAMPADTTSPPAGVDPEAAQEASRE